MQQWKCGNLLTITIEPKNMLAFLNFDFYFNFFSRLNSIQFSPLYFLIIENWKKRAFRIRKLHVIYMVSSRRHIWLDTYPSVSYAFGGLCIQHCVMPDSQTVREAYTRGGCVRCWPFSNKPGRATTLTSNFHKWSLFGLVGPLISGKVKLSRKPKALELSLKVARPRQMNLKRKGLGQFYEHAARYLRTLLRKLDHFISSPSIFSNMHEMKQSINFRLQWNGTKT